MQIVMVFLDSKLLYSQSHYAPQKNVTNYLEMYFFAQVTKIPEANISILSSS